MVPTPIASQGGTKHSHEIKDSQGWLQRNLVLKNKKQKEKWGRSRVVGVEVVVSLWHLLPLLPRCWDYRCASRIQLSGDAFGVLRKLFWEWTCWE